MLETRRDRGKRIGPDRQEEMEKKKGKSGLAQGQLWPGGVWRHLECRKIDLRSATVGGGKRKGRKSSQLIEAEIARKSEQAVGNVGGRKKMVFQTQLRKPVSKVSQRKNQW